MIALYRKTDHSEAAWLSHELDSLLELARPGDSLHNVSEEIAQDPRLVLPELQFQRACEKGKLL